MPFALLGRILEKPRVGADATNAHMFVFIETFHFIFSMVYILKDSLCALVVRDSGYISRGPGSIPGSTQPLEYN
jgi:hypothetical protein